MEKNLQVSLGLLTVGAQLVTDYGNNIEEARRLLDSFFRVSNPPMTAAQLQAIGSKYSPRQNFLQIAHANAPRRSV